MDIRKLLNEYGDNVFSLAIAAAKSTQTATEIYFNTFEKALSDGVTEEKELYKICATLAMEADVNEEISTITDFKMKKNELAFFEKLLVQQQKTRIIMHLYYNYDYSINEIAYVMGTSEKLVQKFFDEAPSELHELAEENYLTAMIYVNVPNGTVDYALEKFTKGNNRLFEVKDAPTPRHTWTAKQKTGVTIVGIVFTVTICICVPIIQMLINQARDTEDADLNQSEPSVVFTAAEETEEDNFAIFE